MITAEDGVLLNELMQEIEAAVLKILHEYGMVRVAEALDIEPAYIATATYHAWSIKFRKADEVEVVP